MNRSLSLLLYAHRFEMYRVTGGSQFIFGANQVIKICKKDP